MKTFTPKSAALNKKEIWLFFYSKEMNEPGLPWFEYASSEDVKLPAFTADEMPNKLCQQFVDAEESLRDEFDSEENFVDARDDLARDFHKRILKALKRKN